MLKKYFILILVILFILPIVATGSSFISSMIQGKTVEEAIEILAEEIGILKQNQKNIEKKLEKEKACNDYNKVLSNIKETCMIKTYPGINACIWYTKYRHHVLSSNFKERESNNNKDYWVEKKEERLRELNRLKKLKSQYLKAANNCNISLKRENQNSEEYINDTACHIILRMKELSSLKKIKSNPEYIWLKDYCKKDIINS